MRSVVLAGSAVLIMLGGSASAQDYYYEYTEPAPRAETYYYRADPPAVVVRPSSCGEFRYWDGQQCVDARAVPPAVR
jgi:hypothetical protein